VGSIDTIIGKLTVNNTFFNNSFIVEKHTFM
jgi:hypothetical protein